MKIALKGQHKSIPMPQSLSKLFIHLIFHIHSKSTAIRVENKAELYSYIGGVLKNIDCRPIKINGTNDHIHILCVMSKNIAVAQLVEDVKRNSSRWIKGLHPSYAEFAWQGGYAAFSVSASACPAVAQYIEQQEDHHRKVSFREELIAFCEKYEVDFDARYLFAD